MARVLTGAALILLLAGALVWRWESFAALLAAVAVLAWRELDELGAQLRARPLAALGTMGSLTLLAAFAAGDAWRWPVAVATILAAAVAAVAARRHSARAVVGTLASTVGGILWIGLPLAMQLDIRVGPFGVAWLALLYAAVAFGDTAAFYGGTAMGRRRLAAELSPKKSVEGALFGLAGSAAGALIVAAWIPHLSGVHAAVIGVVLGAVGQAGDLAESALKRVAGVKDSSNLLPGHGGVLDRIDAYLFATPVLWLLLRTN